MDSFYDITKYTDQLSGALSSAWAETKESASQGLSDAQKMAEDELKKAQELAKAKLEEGRAMLASVQTGVENEVKSIAASSSKTLENYKNAAKAAYTAYAEPVKAVAAKSQSTVSIPTNLSQHAVANMQVSPTADTEPSRTSTIEIPNPIKFVQNVADNFSYTGLLQYELSGLEAGAAALQAPYMQEVENGNLEALDSPHLKAGVAVYTGVQFVKGVASGLGAISGTGEFIKQLPEAGLEYVSDSILNGELGDPVETLENTPHYNDARATLGFVGQVAELSQKGKVIDGEAFNKALANTINNQNPNSDLAHDFAVYYSTEIILNGIEGTQMGAQVFLGDDPNLPWHLRMQNMAGSALGYVVPTKLRVKGEIAVKEIPRETAPKTSRSLPEIDSQLFREPTQLIDEVTDVGTEPTVELTQAVEKPPPWLSQHEFSLAVEQMSLRLDELGNHLKEEWTSNLAEQKRRIKYIEEEIKGHGELLGWIEKNGTGISGLDSLINTAKNKIEALDPSVVDKFMEVDRRQRVQDMQVADDLADQTELIHDPRRRVYANPT